MSTTKPETNVDRSEFVAVRREAGGVYSRLWLNVGTSEEFYFIAREQVDSGLYAWELWYQWAERGVMRVSPRSTLINTGTNAHFDLDRISNLEAARYGLPVK